MTRKFWHPQEVLTTQELAQLQFERLTATVERAYSETRFYKQLFNEHGVKPDQLKTLNDFWRFPFVYPRDLREHPLDFRVASADITAIHCSGGTIGQPKTVLRTYQDYVQSCEILARLFYTNGIRAGDVVAILQPFGLWAIGFLAFEGLKRLNATALPIGIHMDDKEVIKLLRNHRVTGLFITPSNCVRLTDLVRKQGLDTSNDFCVNIIVLAGEKLTAEHRQLLSEAWDSEIFNTYGSEETDGLGTECPAHRGIHFCADQFFLEVIDSETQEEVESGEMGEAVITTLTKEGTPLIRYRIGDLIQVLGNECECGRTLPLIDVKGRVEEFLVLTEGTKLYPFQVEDTLRALKEKILNYQVIREKDKQGRDLLNFIMEVPSDSRTLNLEDRITAGLKRLSIDFTDAYSAGLVNIKVNIVEPGAIRTTARGKIAHFLDRAKIVV